jgi:predicted HTH domain antitoxin
MSTLTIEVADEVVKASGKSPQALATGLKLTLALELFADGKLSLGKAAESAGMPKILFMDELAKRQIPVINLAPDQIADELRDP